MSGPGTQGRTHCQLERDRTWQDAKPRVHCEFPRVSPYWSVRLRLQSACGGHKHPAARPHMFLRPHQRGGRIRTPVTRASLSPCLGDSHCNLPSCPSYESHDHLSLSRRSWLVDNILGGLLNIAVPRSQSMKRGIDLVEEKTKHRARRSMSRSLTGSGKEAMLRKAPSIVKESAPTHVKAA